MARQERERLMNLNILIKILPWFMSASTITVMLLAGRKHKATWYVALLGQVIWTIWIVLDRAWGLAPGSLVLWCVYADNLRRWRGNGQAD
jgi:hypothetical protein